MSLLKWTLALAGTTMGLRYLSGRHRRRLAPGSAGDGQIDRDDDVDVGHRPDTGTGTATSATQADGGSSGPYGRMAGGVGTSTLGHDTPSTPDTTLAPGDPAKRF